MDKTHHADDETLEYIASLEQKNARLREACVAYQEIIPALRDVPHLVAARIAFAYAMADEALSEKGGK